MSAPLLPFPRPAGEASRDDHTGPWFDALHEGVLLLRRCERCGRHSRPDAAGCPACHSDDLRWTPAQGAGTVVTRITDHTDPDDELHLGLIELGEGPWLHARLIGEPEIGEKVELVVLVPDEGEPVPAFRRAE